MRKIQPLIGVNSFWENEIPRSEIIIFNKTMLCATIIGTPTFKVGLKFEILYHYLYSIT